MSYHVVHVIQRLSRGGAGRSLVAVAREVARLDGSRHTVLSLLAPESKAESLALSAGLEVCAPDDRTECWRVLDAADIVHVHFWNTPELDALLRDWRGPARVILWSHVAGHTLPQVLTPALAAWPDTLIVSAALTLDLPATASARAPVRLIAGAADFSRLDGLVPRPHEQFVVGYLGTVDPIKMHSGFVEMAARVRIPNVRFHVCGSGHGFARLQAEATARGIADRFAWRGYVEDVAAEFSAMDVFGYPLAPGTYATTELVLQEAMAAGVPPVVLADGAPAQLVRHDETGLVARTEGEYVEALETLHRDPGRRRRLGEQASAWARATFGADRAARAFATLYEERLAAPKRERTPLRGHLPPNVESDHAYRAPGALRFLSALGSGGGDFLISLAGGSEQERYDAELRIAAAGPALADASAGGILHYRRVYPRDPVLRLWGGLACERLGRHALAVAEFHAAIAMGEDHRRCWRHLARVARLAGSPALADQAEASARRLELTPSPAGLPVAAGLARTGSDVSA